MTHGAVLVVEDYYRRLIDRFPPASFCEFFHLPAAMVVGETKIPLAGRKDVEAAYERLLRKYAAEGITSIVWDPRATTVVEICPGLALVKTILSRMNAEEKLVKTWVCSYLMREVDGRWRCDLVTATPN